MYGPSLRAGTSGSTVSAPVPPVPDALLAPLLDEAGDALRALDAEEAPAALRPLRGFDRRGLAHGPARRQLRRALETDDAFREQVVARFLAREEVAAVLAAWEPESSAGAAEDAADRADLALLASALWAARPEGYAFGLGALSAVHERRRRDWGDAADARALEQRLVEHEEARRRAETARRAAEADAARLEAALHEERRSRRAREEQAAGEADDARRHAAALEVEVERAADAAKAAVGRADREAQRARALEDDVRRLRTELAAAREALRESPPPGLAPDQVRVVADAAAAARRLADGLAALLPSGGAASTSEPVAGAPAATRPGAEPAARTRPLARRVPPVLPPGLVGDSVAGLTAMLRTPGLVLVVDGYNVSQRAWHEATPSEQRTRLAMALAQLHLRHGCEATVVFDGDGTEGVPPFRRPGLRVLFSSPGEEADEVVVRLVAELPKRVPVIVVSSDAWVREHAEGEGASVVSADTLLAAFAS